MTRRATPEEQSDHDRDLRKHDAPDRTRVQQLAIAKLIGALEGIVESGIIAGADAELEIRVIIADALAAFNLPTKWELGDMPRVAQ